ncbi:MAG: hypothetical protein M3619_12100, partial [Myxococcota bacterium]|nr:hypothetical protein [Myxococcota bacterium]
MPRRFRDVLAWSTALPGSAMMVGCLFLPQLRDCHGREETPLESGLAALMIPIALFGLMPLLWRCAPSLRRVLPQLVLAFAVLALTWLVVTIPLAVLLLWTYARGSRGQELVAMCSAPCVMLFIFLFPLLGMFCTWLPGAMLTWAGAWLELVGLVAWAGA